MESTTWMLLIGGAFALIFGPRVAQSTGRREKSYGGSVAQIFNLLACMAFVALPVTVLTGLLTHFGARTIIVGFSLLGFCLLMTLGYAIFEKPAHDKFAASSQRTALNSWTAEDAKNSGL